MSRPSAVRVRALVAVAAVTLVACGAGDTAASDAASPSAAVSPSAYTSPSLVPSSPSEPTAPSTASTDGQDAGEVATPPSEETAEISAAAPAFPADTSPDRGEAAGDIVAVQDVRTGVHDGFDRVVLDLAGDGRAGWQVEYVAEPASQGSGEEVSLRGDAALQVRVFNTTYPPDAPGEVYDGPSRIDVAGAAVTEVVDDKIFEGQHVFFVGVDRERPFRVFRLDDPQRIVIDVRTN